MSQNSNEFILCESVFLSQTRKPAVKITLDKSVVTVSVEDARAFAINLLGACEGAETDAFFFSAGMPDAMAAALVRKRREYRGDE